MPLILLFGLFLVLAGSPLRGADKDPASIVESLAHLRFDQLGHPQIQTDSIRPVRSSPDRPHRLLIIPVQFSDLRFERFRGEPDAEEKNRRYLQELLFSENLRQPRRKTLSHYYHHQSRGRFSVTGTVFSLVTVDKPLSHYGRPSRQSDGEWRSDNSPESLVEDAFRAAYAARPDFPWGDFDVWDPTDYDGDGVSEEPDGYIDHFVLVYAGKGQSSCQGLYKLSEKFTANAPSDLVDKLSPRERECADRIWPHRYALSKNLGRGPTLEGITNDRGGIRVREGLWVYDYNMQSEYTSVSTFIHEFGHSLGLPDIYARRTNNSTAAWDAMSSTAGRFPQELSAWSRMMLGWLEPCVLRPPEFGGAGSRSVHLKTMNDWSGTAGGSRPPGLCDAVMVILPPKVRALDLGPLTSRQRRQAVYTGQGNEMNRYLSRTFDLTGVEEQPILEFDLWFEIEGDYDYLYLEASTDGLNYQRLLPTDKDSATDAQSIMPSRKGHDGDGTLPGFTGRSGDLDADGKVESAPGCDPSRPKQLAEDRVGGEQDPCEIGQWIRARFDLSAYRGKEVEIRFHYFTDMAAVEAGALIDNVKIEALGFSEDFEGSELKGWEVEGFSLSGGAHRLPVPHFYVLEYRDPWQDFEAAFNYDSTMRRESQVFYRDPESGEFRAFDVRYRSGVVLWYANGSFLWSQNEPSMQGPGQGFLLVVDSNPQEFRYPAVPAQYFKREKDRSYYDFDEKAQEWLRRNYLDILCFQRRPEYFPPDLPERDREACRQGKDGPPLERLRFQDKKLVYGYTLYNELLPGPDREPYRGTTNLVDIRLRKNRLTYRLYDRLLRFYHSADAPFALEPFRDGIVLYREDQGQMVPFDGVDFPALHEFSDSDPARYLNPHLPFGSARIPTAGFGFRLAKPGSDAPRGARVKVQMNWTRSGGTSPAQ